MCCIRDAERLDAPLLTPDRATLIVEVPIDNQIMTWTAALLPGNWEQLRGLALLPAGALF